MEDLKLLPEMEDKILPFLDDICLCSLYIAKISQISSKIGRYLFVLNNLPHLDDLWPSKTFQFWNATIPGPHVSRSLTFRHRQLTSHLQTQAGVFHCMWPCSVMLSLYQFYDYHLFNPLPVPSPRAVSLV